MSHYNKRSRTPGDRHKRPNASYRTKPAAEGKAVKAPAEKTAEKEEKIIAEAEVMEKKESEITEIPAETAQNKSEKQPVSKEQKKAMIARFRLDEIDRLASIPRAGILQTLFRPSRAMERLSEADAPTLSQFSCLFLCLFKWIAFGCVPAALTARIINSDPLTYGHMNFTAQGAMALAIGLFMTFAEYYLMFSYDLFCRIIKEELSLRSVISVHARGALQIGMLYLIAALCMKGSMWIGIAFWAAVSLYGMLLSGYALDLTVPIPKTMQLAVFLVVAFFMVLCSGIFFQLTLKNAADVFRLMLKI